MSGREPSWELLKSFLAVVREGSLSGAARALGLSQPTLGRQVAALEDELGVALFTRSPGGLIPTEAALSLQPHAEAMAASAAALARAAVPDVDGRGVVRITASDVVGGAVLPSILAEIRDEHPRLTLELVLSNRNDDLLRREADIAVRMATPTQGALYGRQVGTVSVGLFASPSYIQRHGVPTSLEDRAGHTIIGFDHVPTYASDVVSTLPIDRDLFDIRCDSDLAHLALLQAGAGIGACQLQLGEKYGLTPVLPGAFQFDMPMWVIMHEDQKATRRIRLVFDALVEGLRTYVSGPG